LEFERELIEESFYGNLASFIFSFQVVEVFRQILLLMQKYKIQF
jgi:hypothetical protein